MGKPGQGSTDMSSSSPIGEDHIKMTRTNTVYTENPNSDSAMTNSSMDGTEQQEKLYCRTYDV
jgi:hypothetical protein